VLCKHLFGYIKLPGVKHKLKLDVAEIEKKNYHLFIHLTIKGKPCRLLLDTGASKTVFDKDRVLQYTTKSKVKSNKSKSVGLGVSEMETFAVTLNDVKAGKLSIKKLAVAVLEIGHVNLTYSHLNLPQIDGVLGSDFLMKYNAVIDYKSSTLKLSK
jgi:hypothetical protein